MLNRKGLWDIIGNLYVKEWQQDKTLSPKSIDGYQTGGNCLVLKHNWVCKEKKARDMNKERTKISYTPNT